jgi:hypothetical protein
MVIQNVMVVRACGRGGCPPNDRQEERMRKGVGTRCNLQRQSSLSSPVSRSYLLKLPEPPKTTSPSGGQPFNI